MAVTVFDVGESSGTEIKQCIRGGNKSERALQMGVSTHGGTI